MKDNLYHTTKRYMEIIEKIEETTDPEELKQLEEQRVERHWKFIDLLKA